MPLVRIRGFAIIACGALLACAPTPRRLTREQWLEMRQHTFHNTTPPAVYQAAEKVLRLASKELVVQNGAEGMTATRAAVTGYAAYSYLVKAVQDGSNVNAELTMTEYGNYRKGNDPVSFHEAYDLFFGRIEALLGAGEWHTCREYPEDARAYITALCGRGDDEIPEGVRLSAAAQAAVKK